jgi:cellulose biosynthesis protein BcsQ/uncharacterized protein YprB with RNaseH-like and TPR domain
MGQIITFYSYKGGVGRTMALANTAVTLAQWNYDVLIVDWDLEAPGLDNYFTDYIAKGTRKKKGLLDIITSQLVDRNRVSWNQCISQPKIPNISGKLDIISSGKEDSNYFARLNRLDLDLLYNKNGGQFVDTLRKEWKEKYDFVLVDSRTGITDIGGICTVQLPDMLVLFFISNDQSFFGVIDVVQKVAQARQRLPVERLKLISLPVPSKFDTQKEYEISQWWLDRFANHLSNVYDDWLPSNIDRRSFLEITKIPYIPYFSFGEKLAVMEQDTDDPAGLSYAYEGLASLISHNLEKIDLFKKNRAEYINIAKNQKANNIRKIGLGGEAYLDVEIEISSQGKPIIRVIGIYVTGIRNQINKLIQLYGKNISKRKLFKALNDVKTIYTFNGSKYDIPIINENLNIDLEKQYKHQDLMYDCWKLRLFGGLRSIESQLHISVEMIDSLQVANLPVSVTRQPELDQILFTNRDNVLLLKLIKEKLAEYLLAPERLKPTPPSDQPANGQLAKLPEGSLPEFVQPLPAPKHRQLADLPKAARDIWKKYSKSPDSIIIDKWQLPPIHILDSGPDYRYTRSDLDQRANTIEEALSSYGVEAKVVQINVGPTVTQFGVEPGWVRKYRSVREKDKDGKIVVRKEETSRVRVRVDQITRLANDLALALAAPSIRIEAPVPGQAVLGIEVPNTVFGSVALRSVIESAAFQKIKAHSKLAIALGKTAGDEAMVADLAKMSHLLIGGATSSGKTTCLNAIISCLLMHNTPDEIRLILVDPKRVELTQYNDLPHLAFPVIVDIDRALGVIRWMNKEMDDRYGKLSAARERNIEGYNKKRQGDERLPYLILIIDELVDLMMAYFDEVENILCRLAQLSKPTGIHIIIATQRPSVDVITGLIKANFPTRISFAVTSQADSRTILDMVGAEKLLGRGDMLYMPTEAGRPRRLQGSFVSDDEVDRLVHFWGAQ